MPHRRKKLTFAISSPDELLLNIGPSICFFFTDADPIYLLINAAQQITHIFIGIWRAATVPQRSFIPPNEYHRNYVFNRSIFVINITASSGLAFRVLLCYLRSFYSYVANFSSIPSQEVGWIDERLRNYLFCVEWDVKPELIQSACIVLVQTWWWMRCRASTVTASVAVSHGHRVANKSGRAGAHNDKPATVERSW